MTNYIHLNRPMLAGSPKPKDKSGVLTNNDLRDQLRLPALASPKLDGIRALVFPEAVMSRSFKPIPNRLVQSTYCRPSLIGRDGELITGDPTAKDVYHRTHRMVMTEDAPIDDLKLWVFDSFTASGSFKQRLAEAHARENHGVVHVPHVLVSTMSELLQLEEKFLEQGYEGLMLRSPMGPYKQGRSTVKEAFLVKLKRFVDSEAIVLRANELQHNFNQQELSPTGHQVRSSHKANKVGGLTMGSLTVKDLHSGVTFDLGTGFTEEMREEWWAWWTDLKRPERIVKYKSFPVGVKDKPRHPTYLGIRDRRDL